MKKKRQVFLLGAVILLTACILWINQMTAIPRPEEIWIYQNGSARELHNTDPYFSLIYRLLGMESHVQETAIDPDTVEEIKESLAVECIFQETQCIGQRSYDRLLFSLSGWTEDCVVLHWEGEYLSGTYKSRMIKPILTAILENMQS